MKKVEIREKSIITTKLKRWEDKQEILKNKKYNTNLKFRKSDEYIYIEHNLRYNERKFRRKQQLK